MKDLGGAVFAVCNHANAEVKSKSDLLVELNIPAHELALLAPSVVPAQLLGFFTGISKGLNPDAPKNLSRVVMLD
jgi:glucosamine 6-phosphate synthetase-like amidotransferase/phosphosugar isomerase protein